MANSRLIISRDPRVMQPKPSEHHISALMIVGTRTCRGTGYWEIIPVQLATVLIAPYFFLPGTGHMWHYMKYVGTLMVCVQCLSMS